MEMVRFDTHQRLSAIITPFKYIQCHSSEDYLFSSKKNLWRRLLEANKRSKFFWKAYLWKSELLQQIKSWGINILTGITDWKFPCIYSCSLNNINWRPSPFNSLSHANNRKYFLGVSRTRNWGKAHMVHLAKEVGKIWRYSCWEKGTYILISEFKYGQPWIIWPSPLSLSLYSIFKEQNAENTDWSIIIFWDQCTLFKSCGDIC